MGYVLMPKQLLNTEFYHSRRLNSAKIEAEQREAMWLMALQPLSLVARGTGRASARRDGSILLLSAASPTEQEGWAPRSPSRECFVPIQEKFFWLVIDRNLT